MLSNPGLPYSLGFVDVIPRPAPTVGGWLRQIQPLLMLPNYRVSLFGMYRSETEIWRAD